MWPLAPFAGPGMPALRRPVVSSGPGPPWAAWSGGAVPGGGASGGRGNGSGCWRLRPWCRGCRILGGPSSGTTAPWRAFRPPEIFLGKEQAELGFILPSMPLGWFLPFGLFSSVCSFVCFSVRVLVTVSGWSVGRGPCLQHQRSFHHLFLLNKSLFSLLNESWPVSLSS